MYSLYGRKMQVMITEFICNLALTSADASAHTLIILAEHYQTEGW